MKKIHLILALLLSTNIILAASEREDIAFLDELYKQKKFSMEGSIMNLVLSKIFETSVLVSPKKALQLCSMVARKIKKGDSVVIDFNGIKATTLAFLYVLFSNIVKECGKDVKSLVSIENASKELKEEFKYLKQNYKELCEKFSHLDVITA